MFHNTKKKQIILVRHAKVVERIDWKGKDFDRPLTPEGERANEIVANYLRLIGVRPDRIVASPAARTRVTAEGMAKKLSVPLLEYKDELYNESGELIRFSNDVHMEVVHSMKKTDNTLMIVGHNPDLTKFANHLSGDEIPSMKKGSIIVLSLPEGVEWKSLEPEMCKFIYYLTPQFLRLEELV